MQSLVRKDLPEGLDLLVELRSVAIAMAVDLAFQVAQEAILLHDPRPVQLDLILDPPEGGGGGV